MFRKSLHFSSTSKSQIINKPKIFKGFFACKVVLVPNHQQPEKIQRLFCQQNCLSRKSSISRKYSETFRPARSDHQQQAATAINSSDQQQSTAINSSNEQQQPALSYQQHLHDQRQHLLVITTIPSRGYPARSWPRISCPIVECNHRTKAHFCYFFLFF